MASNNSNSISEDKKRLMYSIMQMIQRDADKSNGEGDRQKGETLEIVLQCLSEVYEVDLESDAIRYKGYSTLEALYEKAKGPIGSSPDNPKLVPSGGATPEEILAAEEFKRQGNEHMKSKEFEQAINAYSKAIERNDEKSEYYCNRAAAYSKTGKHDRAIEDCLIALGLKEDYARAHGRLGFAYYQLGKHLEAKQAYKRAIELESDNAGYKHNLDSLERTLREKEEASAAPPPVPMHSQATAAPTANFGGFGGQQPQQQQPAFPGFGGMGQMPNLAGMGGLPNLGGMDMNSLMSNPAFMNMASQMMSDPNMMSMANQFASQMNQSGVNPMGGFPGMFPQPPNPPNPPQQPPQPPNNPPNDNNADKKDEKKDKDKDGKDK